MGVWTPKLGVTPQSILGPLSYEFLAGSAGGFQALRDPATGDVWFTLLLGQAFRVGGTKMQYCFSGDVSGSQQQHGTLMEQSPFGVVAVNDTFVRFCWREGLKGMPTHAANCTGCDCASINLALIANGTVGPELDFTFWQSPPVVHAHAVFELQSSTPPAFKDAITSHMSDPYEQCQFVDHYGMNVPGQPDLTDRTPWPIWQGADTSSTNTPSSLPSDLVLTGMPAGCARRVAHLAKSNPSVARLLADRAAALDRTGRTATATAAGTNVCAQLNGLNKELNAAARLVHPKRAMAVRDVRLQYTTPNLPCAPCAVSYSVSAAVSENEYIALGFKGQSWEHMDPIPPNYARPCYFGMCVDAYDNFTTDRIAVGYATPASGSCVREMSMPNLVGEPTDVSIPVLKNTSVERVGERTVMKFTAVQHWPDAQPTNMTDGPFRVMWAIGSVTGDAGANCRAQIGYHGPTSKGVAPIKWLVTLGSTPCTFDPSDM